MHLSGATRMTCYKCFWKSYAYYVCFYIHHAKILIYVWCLNTKNTTTSFSYFSVNALEVSINMLWILSSAFTFLYIRHLDPFSLCYIIFLDIHWSIISAENVISLHQQNWGCIIGWTNVCRFKNSIL